eukprot:768095-Hanusia_phi.AAC.1
MEKRRMAGRGRGDLYEDIGGMREDTSKLLHILLILFRESSDAVKQQVEGRGVRRVLRDTV